MNTKIKTMALAMIAVAMATAKDVDDCMAYQIANEMVTDESMARDLADELIRAKEAAENDMADEFAYYTWKDSRYLSADLEGELNICNDRKRAMDKVRLPDSIEEAMQRRHFNHPSADGGYRA